MNTPLYKFNKEELSFKKIKLTLRQLIYISFFFFIFLYIIFHILSIFFDSYDELKLKKKLYDNNIELISLENKVDDIYYTSKNIEFREKEIYNNIFGNDIKLNNSDSLFYLYTDSIELFKKRLYKKIDITEKILKDQKIRFDDYKKLSDTKNNMLNNIPSIQPIDNKHLIRLTSGFGYRNHPIYKIKLFHEGIDYSAPIGSKVYSTGNGIVSYIKSSKRGYGNYIIIDHGYGYKTLYGHLEKINVKLNESVKRGQIIGYVGNTGLSTGPHLHYEVIKNDKPVDPINYYFEELSPEQYEDIYLISINNTKSMD